jgi:hypothetical protein
MAVLTMYFARQPVAAGGNGFLRFGAPVDLPLIAPSCNHGAP